MYSIIFLFSIFIFFIFSSSFFFLSTCFPLSGTITFLPDTSTTENYRSDFIIKCRIDMDSWIDNRSRLLALERDEERKQLQEKLEHLSPQACAECGISLLSIEISESFTSLFGRTTFVIKRLDDSPFPAHSFRVGDEAVLFSPKLRHTELEDSSTCRGVISKVTYTTIDLVCDSSDEADFVQPLRLDMSTSESNNRKLMDVLNQLSSREETPAFNMIRLVFEDFPLSSPTIVHIDPLNIHLNASQVSAIQT